MKTWGIYGLAAGLIIGWWVIAFKPMWISSHSFRLPTGLLIQDKQNPQRLELNLLSIERQTLQKALSGDISLISTLIVQWDVDSQLMQTYGIHHIQRLQESDFLRSQLICRMLKNSSSQEIIVQREHHRLKHLTDDDGHLFNTTKTFDRSLPQTYTAASFLLAIASPSKIVALPHKLRMQVQLYPKTITNQIPLDIDRYHSEKLFQADPEIAFISHYSHPSTVQTLSNQGVVLYMMKNLNTMSDISEEILKIGSLINHSLEADLLRIFMQAAMIAIDNQLSFLSNAFNLNQIQLPKTLFLYHYQNFSVPSPSTLTGHLLERMKLWGMALNCVSNHQGSNLATTISKEQIVNFNPDCLIIASENHCVLEKDFLNDPALNQLSAVQRGHIYFVDEAIQQSPSQYIVLAYYDIMQAMARNLSIP